MEVHDAYASSANMSSFLGNYTRGGICYNISVYTSANVALYSAVKPGCNTSSYPVTFYRGFIAENDSYAYAFFRGWYQ